MKKTSKMIAVLMAMLMVLALGLSACGSKPEETADDGQNPVMNFVGDYVCGRANIYIEAIDGENGANAIVTWGGSASENSTWTMSGIFDPDALQIEYSDCVRTNYVYNENGDIESQEEVYTGGHGFIKFTDGDKLSLTWQDDEENVAEGMVFEYGGGIVDGGNNAETGMANPWSTADSLEAAAEGAGIDGFMVPEGDEISLGKIELAEARYMEGLAEACIEFPAVEMRIRKGDASVASDGDISGDYNEYANSWTQNIKGLEVTCFGNREGDATKTIWHLDDTCYSITAYGLGGDTDYGLSADDLNTLINGIQ